MCDVTSVQCRFDRFQFMLPRRDHYPFGRAQNILELNCNHTILQGKGKGSRPV